MPIKKKYPTWDKKEVIKLLDKGVLPSKIPFILITVEMDPFGAYEGIRLQIHQFAFGIWFDRAQVEFKRRDNL